MTTAPAGSSRGIGAPTLAGRERMLRSLRLEPVDRPPVWFMRQAGRHLPGYRTLRERHTFLELCREPGLCVEASCEPWREYGVDGVIVFNDILIPLRDMGMGLDFAPGPRFSRLIRSDADVRALTTPEYGEATDVSRCLRAIRGEIGSRGALLGFVGAPFTVASFAIGGLSSQRQQGLAEIVMSRPALFESLQQRLVEVLASYAEAQVEAGADVIQVFESLAGEAPGGEFRDAGLPWLVRLVHEIKARAPKVPVIVFGRGLWPFIPELAATGAECLSLDTTHDLVAARMLLSAAGYRTALQGNLAPESLLGTPAMAAADTTRLLGRWRQMAPVPGRGPTGWVFNLGHGVPEKADPRAVLAVVEAVREFDFAAGPLRESGR
jgi:uroporphyrinogen decarboxylase